MSLDALRSMPSAVANAIELSTDKLVELPFYDMKSSLRNAYTSDAVNDVPSSV